VLITRLVLGLFFGTVTVGVLPKLPVTFTAALLFAEPAGAAEPPDPAELDDPDDPQPARTAQAASGTSKAAAMRRMGFLRVGFKTR
jgi:hypothetical protein